MQPYMLLQAGTGTVYAFKAILDQYRPTIDRVQREQYTVTGKLDLQMAPNNTSFNYALKVLGKQGGSITIAADTLITATTATYGSYSDLRALFETTKPPDNVLKFRDFDEVEYYVTFSGRFAPVALTSDITGDYSYHIVPLTMRVVR
jgi:hypothetical protein